LLKSGASMSSSCRPESKVLPRTRRS
jgi:hypothetical protein